MSVFNRRPWLRWTVPAAAGVVVLAGAAVGTAGVSADAGLPPMSAQDLLVALQSPEAQAISGTVVVTTDLGLPELPAGMGGSDSGLTSLASGTHTLRVWSDGATGERVDLLAPRGEYDVIRNGNDVWIWDSSQAKAQHGMLPDDANSGDADLAPGSVPTTPQEAADLVLSAIDPTTEVSVTGAGSVAGRAVYDLSLTPRQAGTKVARVVIAVDAETFVPLQVRAFSTETQAPAIDVGFTSVDFGVPEPSVFAFTPPPGADVTEMNAEQASPGSDSKAAPSTQPTVVGEGWNRVVVSALPKADITGASADSEDASGAGMEQLLQTMPEVQGPWGSGRMLDGTLITVILTDDGRVAAGAVTADVLEAALASA